MGPRADLEAMVKRKTLIVMGCTGITQTQWIHFKLNDLLAFMSEL